MHQNKKIATILVLAILVGAGIYYYYVSQPRGNFNPARRQPEQKTIAPQESKIQQITPEILPIGFPANLEIEEGATIVQNFSADLRDSRRQVTRVFESQKSLEENFEFYKKHLPEINWRITNTIDRENEKIIYANQGPNNLMTLTISKNVPTQPVTVDISIEFIR